MLIQSIDGSCTHCRRWPGPTSCWEVGVCLQDPPCVPSPGPGGRVSSARSCEAACCDFGNTGLSSHLSAQEGSGWFVLSGMLAGFLHSRHRVTIAKCHHRFGSSARQTGHLRDLHTPRLCWGCPRSGTRGLASPASVCQEACVLHSVGSRGASVGCFFVHLGNLLAVSKEPWGCCQGAFS